MADDEKDLEGTSSHGNDWEDVSLTASTYAAAPGLLYPAVDGSKDKEANDSDPETSAAIFMSQYFVFPPSDHENLSIESNYGEIHNESGGKDVSLSEYSSDGMKKTVDENWKTKSDDSLHGIEFFDKGKSHSVHAMEFGEGKALQELSIIRDEHVLYDSPGFNSVTIETGDGINDAEPVDPSHQDVGSTSDNRNVSKLNAENKCAKVDLPCEAWWMRQAAYFYNHAKEANTFWSVFVAAALMGFVILGQHWQREKLQLQQLRWQFSISEERMNWMLGPISRFKGILVGGHQRNPMIHGAVMSSR